MPLSKSAQPAVISVQDGARLHYAIPRALAKLGWLEGVFTDFFVRPGSLESMIVKISRLKNDLSSNRMAERRCAEIEDRVTSFPLRSLWWRRSRKNFPTTEDYYEWVAKKTAQWMLKQDFGNANIVHGFIRNLDPAFCATMQQRGLRTIGDQMIAPAAIEAQEMAEQRRRWPGWDVETHVSNERLIAVEEQTWAHLDHITCASEYVRAGLIKCGVSSERISVLPYPAPQSPVFQSSQNTMKQVLRVGFVGSVNLRKGAPVFLEMARRLKRPGIEFIMVGPISLPAQALEELQKHVTLIGPVPRSRVADYLQSFDVFLFPSACEGSAGVVMEALAHGLPIVTTPNSGTVVRHGIEGYVHEVEDRDGMAESLGRILEDSNLRTEFQAAARSRAQSYSLQSYGVGLRNLIPELLT